jgi:hypothetical protein
MSDLDSKIGREEGKQRRALNKAVEAELKKLAKGSGWRVCQGVLFREFKGWFISASPAVWLNKRKSTVRLNCKPMTLDPVFWEIVETESNVSMPLSFRYFGAWTCNTPGIVEHELREEGAAAIAIEAITWLDAQLVQFESWSLDSFLQRLRQQSQGDSYFATVVTTLFLTGDFDTGATLCTDAIQRGASGGFSIISPSGPSRHFPQLALAWLERKLKSLH